MDDESTTKEVKDEGRTQTTIDQDPKNEVAAKKG